MPLNLAGLETPLTLRTATPLSDEELMRFSEESKPYKVEKTKDGELRIMTPVGYIGGQHEAYVVSELLRWAQFDRRGSAVGPNTGFNLPDGSCFAPDAAWTEQARLDALSPEQLAGYPPLCPDFVIEVRSRTDPKKLLDAKMDLWMANGAQLAWVLDPTEGSATIYRRDREREVLDSPAILQGEGPVAGFILDCTPLWCSSAA